MSSRIMVWGSEMLLKAVIEEGGPKVRLWNSLFKDGATFEIVEGTEDEIASVSPRSSGHFVIGLGSQVARLGPFISELLKSFKPAPERAQAVNVYDYALHFLIAHEIAHVLNGHLIVKGYSDSGGSIAPRALDPQTNWALEIHADATAMMLLDMCTVDQSVDKQRREQELMLLGATCAILFLASERSIEGNDVHPDPLWRLQAVSNCPYTTLDAETKHAVCSRVITSDLWLKIRHQRVDRRFAGIVHRWNRSRGFSRAVNRMLDIESELGNGQYRVARIAKGASPMQVLKREDSR